MAVIIGSARIDERGKISGGKAGDQKGGAEVSTQNFYIHSKGWVILRAKSSSVAEKLAKAMKAACNNNHIGYNQADRYSLYNEAKKVGFDISKVTKDCNTDCSALVRVCLAYAGIMVSDFATSGEANVIVRSGKFDKIAFTKESDLRKGDILVTKTSGHTVIVVSAPTSSAPSSSTTYKKCDKKYTSISDALESVGVDGSKSNRTKIAKANGISDYTGTAKQNETLLKKLKAGTLKKA